MTPHLFKSTYGQCDCRWCGRGRHSGDCPVTMDMRRAVKRYAIANGRTWKSRLSFDRAAGKIDDSDLLQFTNIIRPSIWMKIHSGILERVELDTTKELKESLFNLVGRHVIGRIGNNAPFVQGTLQVEGPDDSEYSIAHDEDAGFARFAIHDISGVLGSTILFKPTV